MSEELTEQDIQNIVRAFKDMKVKPNADTTDAFKNWMKEFSTSKMDDVLYMPYIPKSKFWKGLRPEDELDEQDEIQDIPRRSVRTKTSTATTKYKDFVCKQIQPNTDWLMRAQFLKDAVSSGVFRGSEDRVKDALLKIVTDTGLVYVITYHIGLSNRLEGERINMWFANFEFVLATVIIVVYSHDCKDYDLSASDQSLVDMMKHYLHTSRKDECQQQSKTSNAGVTYIRWGKPSCPKGVDIVYTGQVGGNQYTHKGGGVNYLCLPNDPENGHHQSYDNDQVHGGEYKLDAKTKPSGWSESMGDKEIPCAVCYQKRRSAVMMIPGRQTCYKGWN
ncbi:unnamed protein product [Mytilus edulis]|uniref:Uncharacterized protein n=1 Tax=Mytilus edulis TaxID=6550 RepID=A0A8S3UQQ3_MYTED|nr:unnamed protein product [Mytilus edulis]